MKVTISFSTDDDSFKGNNFLQELTRVISDAKNTIWSVNNNPPVVIRRPIKNSSGRRRIGTLTIDTHNQ